MALPGGPEYYGRYGFRRSTDPDANAPDPAGRRFPQVRPPASHQPSLRGDFVCPQAFDPA